MCKEKLFCVNIDMLDLCRRHVVLFLGNNTISIQPVRFPLPTAWGSSQTFQFAQKPSFKQLDAIYQSYELRKLVFAVLHSAARQLDLLHLIQWLGEWLLSGFSFAQMSFVWFSSNGTQHDRVLESSDFISVNYYYYYSSLLQDLFRVNILWYGIYYGYCI